MIPVEITCPREYDSKAMGDFSNLNFIFRFLPLVLIIFYMAPVAFRRVILIAASYAFYASADLRLMPVLVLATIVNYVIGIKTKEGSKGFFVTAIILDVGMLASFKALGAFRDVSFIPMGISFYTFKMISYQADLFKGKIKETTFIDTAAYFALFPQVLMGPIMRYQGYAECEALKSSALEAKKDRAAACLERLEKGLFYFVFGLSFKVLLADHLASLWNAIATIGYDALSTPLAWLGAFGYSMNLYYDFWGYSLMAAGIGVMLGFPFIENFSHPYAAKGVADFYRRWHMTLGSWFRDYIYIPLGGSRNGGLKTVFNLLIVWLLTGVWHGTGLNFLMWGGILFLIIVWEKFVLSKSGVLFSIFSRLHVWILIPLTWVVFAIGDINALQAYFLSLFPVFGANEAAYASDFLKNVELYGPYLAAGLVFLIPYVFGFFEKNRKNPLVVIMTVSLFVMSVYSLANAAGNPFMYMRF